MQNSKQHNAGGTLWSSIFLANFNLIFLWVAAAFSLLQLQNSSRFWLLIFAFYGVWRWILHIPLKRLFCTVNQRSLIIVARYIEIAALALLVITLNLTPSTWFPYCFLPPIFLYTSARALASPATFGSLAVLWPKKWLASNCGKRLFYSVSGGVLGLLGGAYSGQEFALNQDFTMINMICSFLLLLSILNLFIATRIVVWQSKRSFVADNEAPEAASTRNMRKYICCYEAILLGCFGLSLWALYDIVKENIFFSAPTQLSLIFIIAIPILGLGFGALLSGLRAKQGVDLGFVIPGIIGVVGFSLLAAKTPGSLYLFGSVQVLPRVVAYGFGIGFCYGMIVAQLQAWQLYFTPNVHLDRLIIRRGFVLSMTILSLTMAVTGREIFTLDATTVLLGVALLQIAFSAYIFFKQPQFVIRFLILLMRTLMYRIKVFHKNGEIPDQGAAVLVANHVSFVDSLLLQSCTPRPMYFMMHEKFYRLSFLYPWAKWFGFIEVPNNKPGKLRKMFQKTQAVLQSGELLGVFPEGAITRNGIMASFKKGLGAILPADNEIPIIPIRLGLLWGSIFTYFCGKMKLRMLNELPHPASITIGKPMSKTLSGYQMRLIISELGAETEFVPTDRERPLHTQFVRNACRHPFKKHLKDYDGNVWQEQRNFSVLIKAIILSRKIRQLAPDDNKYIGMMLPNCSGAAVVLLAILLADRVPAILNFTASDDAMKKAIKQANLSLILTSKRFLKKLNKEPLPGMFMLEDLKPIIKFKDKLSAVILAMGLPWRELIHILSPLSYNDVNRTGALIFSSGSTGTPKGIMLSHHNINSDLYSFIRIMNWQKSDRLIGNLPVFHSFGLAVCFWLPISSGSSVVYVPNPLDDKAITYALKREKVTLMMATPSFLQSYMRRSCKEDFASLRLVVTGAEKLRSDIAEKFKELTGLSIAEGYGCSELSPVVSINVANSILNLGVSVGKKGSIGTPMPGICVKIVSPDTFETLPADTDGLMLVKGANVMQGYLNAPDLTAQVMRDGFYITGDIARMDARGYITITGRLSRFSKIAGEMVPHELVEKEINELLRTEERCLAVCSAEDKQKGEKLLVLYAGIKLNPLEIIAQLRKKELPNLWIPRAENFFEVKRIPLLGSGKLDLAALKGLTKQLQA